MRINQISTFDVMNSDGVAFTIVLQGCNREPKCEGCHSPHTWNMDGGVELSVDKLYKIILKEVNKDWYDYIVILGGEPLAQKEELVRLLDKINISYKIWLYTSYEIEEVPSKILDYLNVIKCGRYIKEQHVDDFPASNNQKIFYRKDIIKELKRRGYYE